MSKSKRISVGILFLAVLSIGAYAAHAADDGLKSETDILNRPDGCRVFDMVVSPDCDYNYAPDRCDAALKTLEGLAEQLPELNLDASCDVIHTGNFFARMLDELMMNSSSYDGYKLTLTAEPTADRDGSSTAASVQAKSAEACQDALEALQGLVTQGLKLNASCDGSELRVQL